MHDRSAELLREGVSPAALVLELAKLRLGQPEATVTKAQQAKGFAPAQKRHRMVSKALRAYASMAMSAAKTP